MGLLLLACAILFRHPAELFGLLLKELNEGAGYVAGQCRQILMEYVSQRGTGNPLVGFQGFWVNAVCDELLPNPQDLNGVRDTIAANKLLRAHLPHALDISERHNALRIQANAGRRHTYIIFQPVQQSVVECLVMAVDVYRRCRVAQHTNTKLRHLGDPVLH